MYLTACGGRSLHSCRRSSECSGTAKRNISLPEFVLVEFFSSLTVLWFDFEMSSSCRVLQTQCQGRR